MELYINWRKKIKCKEFPTSKNGKYFSYSVEKNYLVTHPVKFMDCWQNDRLEFLLHPDQDVLFGKLEAC